MSEASFWKYLSKLLPKEGHYTRIESHDTAAGFPDVHYTIDGSSGTIELKDAKKPGAKHPFSGDSGLRKSQRAWIRNELEAGGTVFLALQCGNRVYILEGSYYPLLHRMSEEAIARAAVPQWGKTRKRSNSIYSEYPPSGQLRDLLTE